MGCRHNAFLRAPDPQTERADRMSQGENRDRELENILGQFLVASYQSSKLAEYIYDKLSFRGRPREIRLLVTDSLGGSKRAPLLVTIRIEQYVPATTQEPQMEQAGACKIITVLESPPLNTPDASSLQAEVENLLRGGLRWWAGQDQYTHLKLDQWRTRVSLIDAHDTADTNEVYRVLEALEAKRKGEMASP
jgi:hypothetical protein